jgi:hypothetical protein
LSKDEFHQVAADLSEKRFSSRRTRTMACTIASTKIQQPKGIEMKEQKSGLGGKKYPIFLTE